MIINASRSFARQATTLLTLSTSSSDSKRTGDDHTPPAANAWHREMVYRHMAYINALRMSLRREENWQSLSPWIDPNELLTLKKSVNKPTQLLQT